VDLGNQLASAAQMSEQLKRQLAEGDNVVRRLSKIAIAARPQSAEAETPKEAASQAVREFTRDVPRESTREPTRESARDQFRESFREQPKEPVQPASAKLSTAKAVAAAAQAFTERRRTGGLAA
jgi:16S rRNA U1498 N3-methylase RsmE